MAVKRRKRPLKNRTKVNNANKMTERTKFFLKWIQILKNYFKKLSITSVENL